MCLVLLGFFFVVPMAQYAFNNYDEDKDKSSCFAGPGNEPQSSGVDVTAKFLFVFKVAFITESITILLFTIQRLLLFFEMAKC